mmetsp:Transcript_18603/g.54513  ORF Transcript_18603/g.54513 Transcript_18603/m.54513 type:complete len:172 (+) Transcript_18603:2232-2747(+)
MPERLSVLRGIQNGFAYLEDRFNGTCQPTYSCLDMMGVLDAVQVFDPAYAFEKKIDDELVDKLARLPVLRPMLADLKREAAAYMRCAADVRVNRTDIDEFTETVLSFWRGRVKELPSWAKAARIVFAMAPSSAACERVFSLLKSMFGDDQSSALADMLQGSLMLRYNKREL